MKTLNLPRFVLAPLAVAVALSLTPSAFSQILEYKFNDGSNGVNTASTGSNTTSATFYATTVTGTTPSVSPSNLHGAPGSGVSGAAGDLAFDNTATTGFGTGAYGGLANGGNNSAINNLTSFTMQGWINTSVAGAASGIRLMEKGTSTASNYFSVQYNRTAQGTLGLYLNTPTTTGAPITDLLSAFSVGDANLTALNQWNFWAITYDGTLSSGNVKFYVGTSSASVYQLGATADLNAGALGVMGGNLFFGGIESFSNGGIGAMKAWDGYMDNFRIFGTTSGSSGVLSLGQLEALRAVDVVPEPSTYGLLAVAFGAFVMVRRLRKPRVSRQA